MHFFGITVVIICKFLEVVKSNTIILMPDSNNHLFTLSKKKKKFWISSFLAKIKGGKSHNAKNEQNFAPTEISGRKSGRRIQNSAGYIIRPHFIPPFKDFKFESKKNNYVTLKSVNSNFLKNKIAPPCLKRTLT